MGVVFDWLIYYNNRSRSTWIKFTACTLAHRPQSVFIVLDFSFIRAILKRIKALHSPTNPIQNQTSCAIISILHPHDVMIKHSTNGSSYSKSTWLFNAIIVSSMKSFNFTDSNIHCENKINSVIKLKWKLHSNTKNDSIRCNALNYRNIFQK